MMTVKRAMAGRKERRAALRLLIHRRSDARLRNHSGLAQLFLTAILAAASGGTIAFGDEIYVCKSAIDTRFGPRRDGGIGFELMPDQNGVSFILDRIDLVGRTARLRLGTTKVSARIVARNKLSMTITADSVIGVFQITIFSKRSAQHTHQDMLYSLHSASNELSAEAVQAFGSCQQVVENSLPLPSGTEILGR
jgi:hypothetical protein